MELNIEINWAIAVFSFFAAICWLRAGFVKISYIDDGTSFSLSNEDDRTCEKTDILKTADRQTYWNRWAAGAAAIAAMLQSVSLAVCRV